MGLLLEVFLEVGSPKLFCRKKGECGYEAAKTAAGENGLYSSSSPDLSSEKSQECISLQGVHCGRGGPNRFALVTSCRNRRGRPHPLPARRAESFGDLDSHLDSHSTLFFGSSHDLCAPRLGSSRSQDLRNGPSRTHLLRPRLIRPQ